MAVVEPAGLERNGLRPVSDDAVDAIDRIVDLAFWQLMLGDDLDECRRDVRLLKSAIELRFGQVELDVARARRRRSRVRLRSPFDSGMTMTTRADDPQADHCLTLGWTVVDEWLVDDDDDL